MAFTIIKKHEWQVIDPKFVARTGYSSNMADDLEE